MATASISIEVDEAAFRVYTEASDEERRKWQLLLRLRLQDLTVRSRIVLGNAKTEAGENTEPRWTQAKNARRCELINKQLDTDITDAEGAELARLQEECSLYCDQVAPLPFDYVEGIYQGLLARATAKSNGPEHDAV